MTRRAKIFFGVLGIVFILFAEMGLVYKMGQESAIIRHID